MKKDIPFIFGKIASGADFTDRGKETRQLVEQFKSLINTIIISPRRWGKSSLVSKAGSIAINEDHNLRICYMDLFSVRCEEEFYSVLAQKVIAATSTRIDEALRNTKRFIGNIVPNIVLGDGLNEIKFKFSLKEIERNEDDILDLAETIATAKDLKIMICIDEFQNLSVFNDPLGFQKKLRSHWQTHKNVGYCLYGSKRHMMTEFFDKTSKPFYKFGNIMFLNKIAPEYMTEFVVQRFKDTGKSISKEAAKEIVRLTNNHPYYIQQLAQISWIHTNKECNIQTVNSALDELMSQTDIMFRGLTETLTSQQISYLKAVLDGHTKITMSVLQEYSISSSTSASRAKKYLINEDILDDSKAELLDPIFEIWFRRIYKSS